MNLAVVVDSFELQKFCRIASISIAIYDFVLTLPAEWRFYRSWRSSSSRIRLNCVLFILIRYISILVMVISNYGVLSDSFTAKTCHHYYMLPSIFKVLQTMVSQVILGVRTFNITLNNRRVGIALVVLYFVSISVEWFINMFHRIPISANCSFVGKALINGSCTPANAGKELTSYIYYIIAMSYDFILLTISTVYLLRYNPLSIRLGRLLHSLIYEGLGYFVVLAGKYTALVLNTILSKVPSGVNIFNIVCYHTNNVQNQSVGASVGYVVTWFMSQRLLIHRFGRDTEPEPDSRALDGIVFARPVRSARKVMSALRTKFDSEAPGNADLAPTSPRNMRKDEVELGIRVCVERPTVETYMNESEHTSSWGTQTRTT
ncbi:hypothetical protein M405DRAFT_881770 [Rhizopogon salebrosus TDB-379]|nr:hypothetical protein M405DRAFT_881770 [Rhizopogon salebrosus TDB-379]